MDRRKFFKRAAGVTIAGGLSGLAYALLQAKWLGVTETTVRVNKLPQHFQGTSVAFLTDVHHGPFVPRSYIRSAVNLANSLNPDLILLGGDYVSQSEDYIQPVFEELARLKAPLGVFGVLGNHDHWESAGMTRACMKSAGIRDLSNQGVWLEHRGDRLRLGGVGDLWCDRQEIDRALGDATETDTALVLSHNPDFVENLTDRRVGLVLSGHTHGGQVVVPGYGAPVVPSQYGQKYLRGLVQGPVAPVYVSRGVGTVGPPIRFACQPEIIRLTLQTA